MQVNDYKWASPINNSSKSVISLQVSLKRPGVVIAELGNVSGNSIHKPNFGKTLIVISHADR
jgi:hypothetical protein